MYIDFSAISWYVSTKGGISMPNLISQCSSPENISFRYAKGPGYSSGKEFHIYHEIILFFGGNAEFIAENLHIKPKPSTLIVVPKETYHQMIVHGNQEHYERCLLQFDDQPELLPLAAQCLQAVQAIEADREILSLFTKLIQTGQTANPNAPLVLKSVLALLLDLLCAKADSPDEENHQNETVRSAIGYINQNLHRSLSVHDIARACNISESALAHTFQKEMYTSVHKFVLKKRLILAYQKICAGQATTAAALECGFRDYSGFYKQYKKAFGFPPSQKK